MELFIQPNRNEWATIMERPVLEPMNLDNIVNQVFNFVKKNGDDALIKYTREFDKVSLETFKVTQLELTEAENLVSDELKMAIGFAKNNIESFHRQQELQKEVVETTKGVFCWREARAIEKVGIYIPGGTAPLFSTVLMLGVPAMIAGCREIILVSPPGTEGKINPAILYAAKIVGITEIYKVGGIQAVAALTLGTASVPKVDKIFGPGNQYVTAAKQKALGYGVAIDMPAGPSEVLIIADHTANPEFVAADLLSQAEHGVDSQVILLSDNENFIEKTMMELRKQLEVLPRRNFAQNALKNSKAIVLESISDCLDFSNQYAPEHLILAMEAYEEHIASVQSAGSVFLGNYSCESAGDYASGTNHTLPTNGFARNYSGVSLDSFVKKITFQNLTAEGIWNIGPAIEEMAEAEQLFAHKNAVTLRLNSLLRK